MSPEEKKQGQHYFSLQPSEKAVFRSAAEIFAAYVCSGKVSEDNRNEYYKMAIRDAIRIGQVVEKSIQSDEELAV
ncbi:MAG: hypothetical protein JSW23_09000 [Planctomycetota bacterium]|nr:MAG: hypothetical protein JSW23_09000 [Planctomycetota bacterium]